jgi:acyl carrier protein
MTKDEIRAVIITELGNIAPDMDVGALKPDADLRETLDIDSMDFLNFISALHQRLGVDIPERDYPKLFTLADAVSYIEQRKR